MDDPHPSGEQQIPQYPPLNFFYTHFHNSIKLELEALARWVGNLERASGAQQGALLPKLLELRERYRFLEQVYKYHCSVEDEVVYPALDAKVKWVTVAYRVEHQDEELLLEQLAQLISAAIVQQGSEQTETIRGLVCKVEEIHLTLKKHLGKEEEQLLPLLLKHFSFAEQAVLVAQFLYCIPLTMVERVLVWLKPQVPQVEQEQLLQHIRGVIPDDLLIQLLTSWLQSPLKHVPGRSTLGRTPSPDAPDLTPPAVAATAPPPAPPDVAARVVDTQAAATAIGADTATSHNGSGTGNLTAGSKDALVAVPMAPTAPMRPPLKEIIHIHRTICCALEEFAGEARGLQQCCDVTALQLGSLVERHRFLRSVCMFHTISEEEVMYPEVRRLSALDPNLTTPGGEGADAFEACSACEREHESEVSAMEDLGRMLSDVRAFARRGRKEVSQMLAKLTSTAEQVLSSISRHMAREEAEVFPVLERHLSVAEQRAMVWRTLNAMPLRLLERVLPWVTASLSENDAAELRNNIRLGAPKGDLALVELLLRWADRGRASSAVVSDGEGNAGGVQQNGGPGGMLRVRTDSRGFVGDYASGGLRDLLPVVPGSFVRMSSGGGGVSDAVDGEPCRKRPRTDGAAGDGASPLQKEDGGDVEDAMHGQNDGVGGGHMQRSGSSPEPVRMVGLGGQSGAGAQAVGGTAFCQHVSVPWPNGGGDTSTSLTRELPGSRGNSPMEASTSVYLPSTAVTGTPAGGATSQQAAAGSGRISPAPGLNGAAGADGAGSGNPFNPIDHIFQFHQALRQEMRQLEEDALRLEKAVMSHILEQQGGTGTEMGTSVSDALSDPQVAVSVPDAQDTTAVRPQQQQQQHEPVDMPPAQHQAEQHAQNRGTISTANNSPAADGSDRCATPTGGVGLTSPCGLERCSTPALSTISTASAAGGGAAATPRRGTTHVPSAATYGGTMSGVGGAGVTASVTTTSYVGRLPKRVGAAVQAFDGRFQFLWGIYRAHSRSEDEIVFPALESKQALRNVSHAYTLDHQQEEQLFLDLEQVMDNLRRCDGGLKEARSSALAVRRMCAAVRASLETHIRAEEAELWPLFTEHFSLEEQQYLVGVIIGRTGAQVLQTLLPWISESFSLEEKELMMGSLRQATKNTMFDQWLEAVLHQPPTIGVPTVVTDGTPADAARGHASGAADVGGPSGASHELATLALNPGMVSSKGQVQQGGMPEPDPELARFLVASTGADMGGRADVGGADKAAGVSGEDAGAAGCGFCVGEGTSGAGAGTGAGGLPAATVESSTFCPGWEDIFRMNQKQLEAAVMRVSADPHLEPGRKAYLIQNIMVSKYIVAQQKRMQREQQGIEEELLEAGSVGVATHRLAVEGADGAGAGVWPLRVVRTFHDAPQGILGCKHYRRKAQLVAPCCQRAFTCRLCHDEAATHRMDRYAVTDMVCMECGLKQPVAGTCSACNTKLARYYCNICHVFDDEPGRQIYHCPFCNMCRRGRGLGIDFFHCMSCNACMSLSLFKSHTCREKAMESNCPVCSEYLFDSADPIKELPCGHLLHSRCFAEYTRYNYTCPLCSKSVGDMSVYFQMLDSLLASERLPPEYAGRMQQILCNDCGKTGFARFHFAYHSCPHCRSYNTRVM